jgi:hypothetical protein
MPINVNDKEKIAHLNAERLLGLDQKQRRQPGRSDVRDLPKAV